MQPLISIAQERHIDSLLSIDEIEWLNENKDSIRYAPNSTWPPGDFIDENGIHQGIVSEYIKIFEQTLNLSFQNIYYNNWHSIIEGLHESEVDFVGAIQKTAERESELVFTEIFLDVPLVILVRDDYPKKVSNSEICKMKIACVKGYATNEYIKKKYPGVQLVECEDDLTAVLKTSIGNTDGTVSDLMLASYIVNEYGINNLEMAMELDISWQLRFACRKELPELNSILNKIIRTINADTRLEIYNKWVNINYINNSRVNQRQLKLIINLAITLLVFFAIVLTISIYLKKQVRKRTLDLNKELEEKKRAVLRSKKNEARLESLFEISKHKINSIEDLFHKVLFEAAKLTDSQYCLLYLYDQRKQLYVLSNEYFASETKESEKNYLKSFNPNNLGDCGSFLQNKSLYFINPCNSCNQIDSKNCVLKFYRHGNTLIVPKSDDDETESILFVANKELDYEEADIKQVLLLLDAVWKLLAKQRWQERLIIAKDKAEESDRLKSAFLTNLSHEIRTPMNAILGFSELLRTPNLSFNDQEGYINIIHKSGNYLLSVITDIVEISKIDSGSIKQNYTLFKIRQLIEDIITYFEVNIPNEKDLTIELLETNIGKDTTVLADEHKLKQIITNLISNAIKYTPDGIIKIKYHFKEKGLFEFYIEDTGIGIDKKNHGIIFEKFRQADIEEGKVSEGTGLGLAISKAYINMLGGAISLKSALGNGSTFIVTIPIQVNNKSVQNVIEAQKDKLVKNEEVKILIAEDDENNYLYISEILSLFNYQLIWAKNGKEAVEILNSTPDIKLVLLDIKMPVMNGYEAIRQIRKSNKTVPVVAQTAYALTEDIEKIKTAGFNDSISKPINKDAFIRLITKFILE